MVGGSTGTVLTGVKKMASRIGGGKRVVAISPDMGNKYRNTIYNDEWVENNISTIDRYSNIQEYV
jgi:cysteine synthase A